MVVPVAVAGNLGSYLVALWLHSERHPSADPVAAWRLVTAATLITVQALWLVWWRRQPVGTVVASLFLWQLAVVVSGPDALSAQPGTMLAVFGLAAERTGAVRAGLVGIGSLLVLFGVALSPLEGAALRAPTASNLISGALVAVGTVALPALTGAWYAQLRDRAERIADLSHQVVSGEAGRTAEAVSAERRTLAHELHDTSSAHLTAIITLSTAAREVPLPADLAPLIAQISADGRALYQGYERMLGSLQQEDRTTPGAHQPGFRPGQHDLGELPLLVNEYARTTGMDVLLEVNPDVAEIDQRLGPVRSHTAYRVVQEALNNARKHAAGARVSVLLNDDGESLLLRIENDAPPPSVEVTGQESVRQGLRLGIVGLRDRLVAAGGSLRTGPRNAGGWAVQALLPHPGRGDSRTSSPHTAASRADEGISA
ncbi:signal transduction histidine kinase [Microbacterium natoriense]|uniref:histidine kinase n=1 Tax=Microbacterium natoriense TaxID=284570 RepID=A0AAW8EZX9_9MICO|nr:histidine kinase [Microbacterium natoriense]MDQ0648224.1 signal transduction histidine kinase [Microbacterium natoriense]